MEGIWNHVDISELWYHLCSTYLQTCCYIRKISPHLKFVVIGAYHNPDTFAFSAAGIHREATLGKPPGSLPFFSELCPSPHSCSHLLLREFSPHSPLSGQWDTAIAESVEYT